MWFTGGFWPERLTKIKFKMFNIVLVSPDIPPNTGNVIRLAANTGCRLHLVEPMGFRLDNAKMKRAGLDYHEWAQIQVHSSLENAIAATKSKPNRSFAMTTKGSIYTSDMKLCAGDTFVFGRETAGLTPQQLSLFNHGCRIRLPMMPDQRSLNLSNAVAVTVYEAWRQLNYQGAV